MSNWFQEKYIKASTWYNSPREYTNGDLFESAIMASIMMYLLGKSFAIF